MNHIGAPIFEIPASFQQRPYAATHFQAITTLARQQHPFYQRFYQHGDGALPLLTRNILQQHNDELLNGYPVTGKTSGATSIPVRVHWSPRRTQMEQQDNRLYGRWLGAPLPKIKIVSLQAHAQHELSMEVASPMAEQEAFVHQRIVSAGARVLISYPTNLVQLARHLLEKNAPIAELQRIVCMSELFEPSQEAVIQQAFPKALIGATFSCTEVGIIAGRCPHNSANYHVFAHKLGVEILDAQDQPCGNGDIGRVVVTDYFNKRMPLIRYELGDLAAPTVCDCGKINLPALTKLIGKSRGLFKRQNGAPLISTAFSPDFRDSPEIVQFQMEQLSLLRFKIRVIAKNNADVAAFEQRIVGVLQTHFGADAEFEFDWCQVIPRLPGGKYLEFISLPDSG